MRAATGTSGQPVKTQISVAHGDADGATCRALQQIRADGQAVLLRSLRASLMQGHWQVACRRYLMLCAVGTLPPVDCIDVCERLLSSLPSRRQRAMRASAAAWSAMVRGEAQPPWWSGEIRAQLGLLRAASPFRVGWYPPPVTAVSAMAAQVRGGTRPQLCR